MQIFGISKVRNEQEIIKDTLNWWGKFCDKFFICDEMSEDRTVEILKQNPKVTVIKKDWWDEDRERAEWVNRQIALSTAQAKPDDWICCFDADEFIYDFNLKDLADCEVVACKLFDVYITPEDAAKTWKERQWIGPEYRLIPIFFKNSIELGFNLPDQRVMNFPSNYRIKVTGTIKHFGKGFSIKQFEETCSYYVKWWPKYRDKWQKRKGHAVHTKSDFNNQLIRWESRNEMGFPLKE